MKIFLFSILLIGNLSLRAQNITSRILNCIEENFALADTGFFKSLGIIEDDLIKQKIIDATSNSIQSQFKNVATIGRMEHSRSVEHILLEQIGISTIMHCTNLITYSYSNESPPELFHFFKDMETLLTKNQVNPYIQRNKHKKQIARLILDYSENIGNDYTLWKAIQILYLYQLTELEEDILLPYLAPLENTKSTVDIMINANGFLELEGKTVDDEAIFLAMKPLIKNKLTLVVNCHESTSFYRYYEVIDQLYQCIELLRNEQAIETFKKNYADLTTSEFKLIHELIPGHIIENPPH